jgi:hypothetical protein
MSDFDGLISAEFKQLFVDAIDALLETTALTILCTLIYSGSKISECPNCYLNQMKGKSSGKYKTGGPVSFNTGVCPVCFGDGKLINEQTEDVYLAVIRDSKQFIGKLPINNPNEHVQTISKLVTYDKIKKATKVIIDTENNNSSRNEFERVNEPNFVGFNSGDYIITTWKRIS